MTLLAECGRASAECPTKAAPPLLGRRSRTRRAKGQEVPSSSAAHEKNAVEGGADPGVEMPE